MTEAAQPRCQGAGSSSCQHTTVTARTFVCTVNPQFAQFVLHVPEQLRGDQALHNTYAVQDEWAFFPRIPPQAITGVHIYEMAGRAAGQALQPQSVTFRYDRWVANPNYNARFRYDPSSDPAAHSSLLRTPMHIPPVPVNGWARGCHAATQCRGGNGG
ncbi:hypothetical protein [Streptomyces sp. NPDC057690]|uniref:hypothetical protein n=1 Tax=Streptomyces sp. NPDC057690 TaxID=3346214 RepID=UPI00369959BF